MFVFILFCCCFLEATPPAAEDEGKEEQTHIQQEDDEKEEVEEDTKQDKQVCENMFTNSFSIYMKNTSHTICNNIYRTSGNFCVAFFA